jgi:hypothetical protein
MYSWKIMGLTASCGRNGDEEKIPESLSGKKTKVVHTIKYLLSFHAAIRTG